MREVLTSVSTAAGNLRAIARFPDAEGPVPGVVLVDGALEGTADGWGTLPQILVDFGVAVLSHDKPGCGGSPGSWLDQTFEDRAHETLAAVDLLRSQSGVDPVRVGLLGASQGGWISMIAASLAPDAVSHIVSISGGGVSVIAQERYRLSNAVGADPEAMAWVDERFRRLLAGESPTSILARQAAFTARPWYEGACFAYDQLDFLTWAQRIGPFDPVTVLPDVRCRVFGAFGGADPDMPAAPNVVALTAALPPNPAHAFAIFPGADHGLCLPNDDESAPLADRLAPGFLPMLRSWLHA